MVLRELRLKFGVYSLGELRVRVLGWRFGIRMDLAAAWRIPCNGIVTESWAEVKGSMELMNANNSVCCSKCPWKYGSRRENSGQVAPNSGRPSTQKSYREVWDVGSRFARPYFRGQSRCDLSFGSVKRV